MLQRNDMQVRGGTTVLFQTIEDPIKFHLEIADLKRLTYSQIKCH